MKNSGSMEIVTAPTYNWLVEHAQSCDSRMLIGCPYVNDTIIDLTDRVLGKVPSALITSVDLRNFAMGSSSLDSLCSLAEKGMVISSLDKFHAKVYIFDDSALVTSANATFNGLRRNRECGLATNDEKLVEQLAHSLLSGLGAEYPPRNVGVGELASLKSLLKAVRVVLPTFPRGDVPVDDVRETGLTFSIPDKNALLDGFEGWQKLTLEGVLKMPDEFTMDQLVAACKDEVARRYPQNLHIRQKFSEQLQKLRDLGFVEFIKPGYYLRTMD